ncbi:hypothetical protein AMJ74_05135 [candidate division WOR_3 bacterium SM1_77]|uniref:Uncharacterized protein n=1 Tax=candidate division WOR_3 bacterium SM1_77 TaxID=1703778 RepID=A0A0S8JV20_UNCW3|nr:MAG: hypothetical protein AMJ74_05135 [candidate division WOR_3 bacterium SM1_77]
MIKEEYKFGCLAINTWMSNQITTPQKICDNLWLLVSPYKWMLHRWRNDLGRFRAKEFEQTNCIILVTKPAQHIDLLDHDNKVLERNVLSIYYALLLSGVARHSEPGFILTGSNKKGQKDVKSYTPLLAHRKAGKTLAKAIEIATVQDAVCLAKILSGIYLTKNKYSRIKKGFRILIDSMRNTIALERLHQSVRAIEAVVRPEKRRTRKHFVERCQFLIGRSRAKQNELGEIFDLRSREEHLIEVDDLLSKYGKDKIDTLIYLRAYQTEIIAEKMYRKILTSQDLRRFFMDDASIKKLWNERGQIIKRLWGTPINLDTLISRRSGFFLRTD